LKSEQKEMAKFFAYWKVPVPLGRHRAFRCSFPANWNATAHPDIHILRVAPCGSESYPFCALVKLTQNATAVEGFARIVEPVGTFSRIKYIFKKDGTPQQARTIYYKARPVQGLKRRIKDYKRFLFDPRFHKYMRTEDQKLKSIKRLEMVKAQLKIVKSADATIRGAVARVRFEKAAELAGGGKPRPTRLPLKPTKKIAQCERRMCSLKGKGKTILGRPNYSQLKCTKDGLFAPLRQGIPKTRSRPKRANLLSKAESKAKAPQTRSHLQEDTILAEAAGRRGGSSLFARATFYVSPASSSNTAGNDEEDEELQESHGVHTGRRGGSMASSSSFALDISSHVASNTAGNDEEDD
jgi:hypothetical protein